MQTAVLIEKVWVVSRLVKKRYERYEFLSEGPKVLVFTNKREAEEIADHEGDGFKAARAKMRIEVEL